MVDTDSQLITAVDVLPGNAPDNLGALDLVEQSEASTGVPVEEVLGDAAYGDGDTRQAFADARRALVARVPGRPNRTHFPKEDFRIDLESGTCTCPAGNVTGIFRPSGTRADPAGRTRQLKGFQFDAAVCGACPMRPQCVAGSSGLGRTVQLHPQEALLQQARALQQSEAFAGYRRRRVVVERRRGWWWSAPRPGWRGWSSWESARPVTSVAPRPASSCTWPPRWPTGKAGVTGNAGTGSNAVSVMVAYLADSAANTGVLWLGQIWTLTMLASASLPKSPCPNKGFRPSF